MLERKHPGVATILWDQISAYYSWGILASGGGFGIPALISFYHKLAQDNPRLRELKASVDYGQVMPNVPQMGRFFSSLGAALQLAVNGRLSPRNALLEAEANMLHP